jgi:hypothetical protein
MANDEERREREDLGQDPFVEKLRPEPSEPPKQVRVLEGLLGDSDREGYKRLYFTRELDHYAEFRTENVVFSEPIPSEQPPLVGLEATRVGIRRDATIEYTRVRAPRPVDEFDLDVRLGGAPTRRPASTINTFCGEDTCVGVTCNTCGENTCGGENTCFGFTCGGEDTCVGDTCVVFTCVPNTCANTCVGVTLCGEQTCGGTCEFTCDLARTCDLACERI